MSHTLRKRTPRPKERSPSTTTKENRLDPIPYKIVVWHQQFFLGNFHNASNVKTPGRVTGPPSPLRFLARQSGPSPLHVEHALAGNRDGRSRPQDGQTHGRSKDINVTTRSHLVGMCSRGSTAQQLVPSIDSHVRSSL
jgi:hypothetical protein